MTHDHMKFASSAKTPSQNKALRRVIRAAQADTEIHTETLSCGSVITARRGEGWAKIAWRVVDGTSGATKTGVQDV
jgi:hypothetical protein